MANIQPKPPIHLDTSHLSLLKNTSPKHHSRVAKISHTNASKVVSFTLLLKNGLENVVNFLLEHGITILKIINDLNTIHATTTVGKIRELFGVVINDYLDTKLNKRYTSHDGELTVPSKIVENIKHIFGFDNTPKYKPFFKLSSKVSDPVTFYPNYLSGIYNFPDTTGKNQTIALIELGGGYNIQTLRDYFQSLNIVTPNIVSVSVDGATNNPYDQSGANGEVQLDIEVVGSLAPDATIRVYFAPNSDQGFYDAILQAINDNVSVISISWGSPEIYYDDSAMYHMNQLFRQCIEKNISVFVAAGDNGSTDGVNNDKENVDYPGSSPYVTCCGGTKLIVQNEQRFSEIVWNEDNDNAGSTGGGVSNIFKVPVYQNSVAQRNVDTGLLGRTVPDVSAVADPETGYIISVDGQLQVIGGTSAVAPLYAAFTARLNQLKNRNVGFLNNVIYSHPECFYDVTVGNNGKYQASSGYDACTGLGVLNGNLLQSLF